MPANSRWDLIRRLRVKRMWKAVTSCYVTDCTEPEKERDRWRRSEEERIQCLVGEGVKASPGAPPWLAPLRLTDCPYAYRTDQ